MGSRGHRLRNPVDRTYSGYHHRVRRLGESRTFEEAIETAFGFAEVIEAEKTRPRGDKDGETSEPEDRASFNDARSDLLSRGIYVDHLLRWSRFSSEEQMLVLKSEDFFERPVETLKVALRFLDLPQWEPEASELANKRNKGDYGQGMDPAIRRRLEEYFEPHNRRLYDYLGVDFGW